MIDEYNIFWEKPDGETSYLMAYGMQSLKNHMDYIMGQGGKIIWIKNEGKV